MDKTARGGETKAKEVPKRIRSCQHGPARAAGSKVAARQRRCAQLLDHADELLDGAESGLALAEAKQAALAGLDRIELVLATAGANVKEALAEQERALEAAVEVDDAPEPAAIERTLGEAADSAGEAAREASRIRRPAPRSPCMTGRGQ